VGEFAALFHQLTLGVYVVGVADAGRRDGFTAAWVMQVSFDPLLLALSINPATPHSLSSSAAADSLSAF
jgi:flavin reductase (DIM6/NTAB) family NADH-FMN oxidoreductase RutF